MEKKANTISRGQAIAFRVPSYASDEVLGHLQALKESEGRNFSSKIADFVLQGVRSYYADEGEAITVPLPEKLSKSQRDWLSNEHTEALIGSIIYQLIQDPIRSNSVLSSLETTSLETSSAVEHAETPPLEDEVAPVTEHAPKASSRQTPVEEDDDLANFTMPSRDAEETREEPEESADDLLGDFLSRMNS